MRLWPEIAMQFIQKEEEIAEVFSFNKNYHFSPNSGLHVFIAINTYIDSTLNYGYINSYINFCLFKTLTCLSQLNNSPNL